MELDVALDRIKQVLKNSGYSFTISDISDEFLCFQFSAERKKYSNPELDPSLHRLNPENSFWLKVKDKKNEMIGTIAGRLINTNSFIPLCRTYRFWYGDKIRFTDPLNIVLEHGDRIPHGRIGYDGAMWVRPDHRNRGLSWVLSRLCRLTAARLWMPHWIFGFGFPGVTSARLPEIVYGYPRNDLFATGFKSPGYPAQAICLATMTMTEIKRSAAEDIVYLARRPNLLLDQAFAHELRERRTLEAVKEASNTILAADLAFAP